MDARCGAGASGKAGAAAAATTRRIGVLVIALGFHRRSLYTIGLDCWAVMRRVSPSYTAVGFPMELHGANVAPAPTLIGIRGSAPMPPRGGFVPHPFPNRVGSPWEIHPAGKIAILTDQMFFSHVDATVVREHRHCRNCYKMLTVIHIFHEGCG